MSTVLVLCFILGEPILIGLCILLFARNVRLRGATRILEGSLKRADMAFRELEQQVNEIGTSVQPARIVWAQRGSWTGFWLHRPGEKEPQAMLSMRDECDPVHAIARELRDGHLWVGPLIIQRPYSTERYEWTPRGDA